MRSPMKSLTLTAGLMAGFLLTGCGLTPQGDALRAAVKERGAQAMDEGLSNAEWFLCEAASVGSVRRRYSGPMSEHYNAICLDDPATAVPF